MEGGRASQGGIKERDLGDGREGVAPQATVEHKDGKPGRNEARLPTVRHTHTHRQEAGSRRGTDSLRWGLLTGAFLVPVL